jgi:hypothetical protein
MDFNKFSKADGLRIIIVLFIIAIVYFGFNSKIWLFFKQITFQPPISPPTLTATPIPTITNIPTHTLTPTPITPTPTPIPTSAFIPGEVISYWNEFDNTDPLRGDWVFFPNAMVENSYLTIEQSDDWSGVYGNPHLHDGQTIMIRFRFQNWSDIHIAVETGEFDTASYRSWGIGSEYNIFSPVYSEGTIEFESSFESDDDVKLDPEEWYVLMLHIGGQGPFVARIWDYSNQSKNYVIQVYMNETWTGQEWLPLFLVGPSGKLEIDRYEELKGYTPY